MSAVAGNVLDPMAFYQLEANDGLPRDLRGDMPRILALPSHALRPQVNSINAPAVLRGLLVDGDGDANFSLARLDDDGRARLDFDLPATIEWILLEKYHAGLEPTAEMRLPFNYSRLPNWLKGLSRRIRRKSLIVAPEIEFPSGDPAFVVEWLRALAKWAGLNELAPRLRPIRWPDGRRAAITISHDVDTDWLFRHRVWLDRFVDAEAQVGLRGAWYCVPMYSRGRQADESIEHLIDCGCEVGCHGYNHDAKWPLVAGGEAAKRVERVRQFRDRWNLRGFRSEWLWRTPAFLTTLAGLFEYDSSVPTVATRFTSRSGNGCGTCQPFETYGGLIELPLTLPMDDEQHLMGLTLEEFWQRQVERAFAVIDHGGLVMLSLHPQPHQAASEPTLAVVSKALRTLTSVPNLWVARPLEIARWTRSWLDGAETAAVP